MFVLLNSDKPFWFPGFLHRFLSKTEAVYTASDNSQWKRAEMT